jgi:hypothetical protein
MHIIPMVDEIIVKRERREKIQVHVFVFRVKEEFLSFEKWEKFSFGF